MRAAVGVALGLAALSLVMIGALALVLPRLIDGPRLLALVGGPGATDLAHRLAFVRLSTGLWPPRIVLDGPRLDPEPLSSGSGLGLIRAQRAELTLSPLALLRGTLRAQALRIDGLELRFELEALQRRSSPIFYPLASFARSPSELRSDAVEGPAAVATRASGLAAWFAMPRLTLRDAMVTLEDAAVTPPARWRLYALRLQMQRDPAGRRSVFEADGRIGAAGVVRATGEVSREGAIDVRIVLESLDAASLAPFFDSLTELEGVLSGSIEMRGRGDRLERLQSELTLEDASVGIEEIHLRGRLTMSLELVGAPRDPSHPPSAAAATGRFEIDAGEAELTYAQQYRKKVGQPATLTGQFGEAGFRLTRVSIVNFQASSSAVAPRRGKPVSNALAVAGDADASGGTAAQREAADLVKSVQTGSALP